MTLTFWEFLDKYKTIVSESRLNETEQEQIYVLEMVSDILCHHVTEQWLLENIPDEDTNLDEIVANVQIKKETISEMCVSLNEEILYEDAIENFFTLLEDQDEIDLFQDIIDIHDENGLEETKKQVIEWDLINSVSKDSNLYSIIEWLYKWEDFTILMVNKLKSLWIDLKTNPIISKKEEIKEFLNDVELFLFSLLTKWYSLSSENTLQSVN